VTPATKTIKGYSGRIIRLATERWQDVIEHSEIEVTGGDNVWPR
jgi:hypothetical protein